MTRKPKKSMKSKKPHKHKYRESQRGFYLCRCGRVLSVGFMTQVMLD